MEGYDGNYDNSPFWKKVFLSSKNVLYLYPSVNMHLSEESAFFSQSVRTWQEEERLY